MAPPAIRAEKLSKQYRIGARQRYRALRDSIALAVAAPVRGLGALVGRHGPPANGEDTIWSLKDVSFEIAPGEVVGVIGRNGAGKSTLLKVLSRITEPTEGRVEIRGRVGSLLEVGTGFHPELSGRENIYLNGAILGMPRTEIQRKFDEIVAFAEIDKFLDTPVKHYSSGMYVRLAFAVAAHLDPEILLVDEVLAVGDAGFQRKCLGKMGDVAKAGRTVVLVSHQMPAIQSLCNRAILLDQGVIAAEGAVQDVVERYLRVTAGPGLDASDDLRAIPRERGSTPVLTEGYLNARPLVGEHTLMPQQPLTFALRVELPEARRQCTVGIHFEDELGVRVYAVNSRWHMRGVELGRGVHRFECRIPEPPLVPGRYYLSVGFSADGSQVDWLSRIACVEFAKTDVYGTGELPQVGQGYFLSRADWEISAETSALRS